MGITKRFGDVVALEDVSVKVETATVHALLGENGAGNYAARHDAPPSHGPGPTKPSVRAAASGAIIDALGPQSPHSALRGRHTSI